MTRSFPQFSPISAPVHFLFFTFTSYFHIYAFPHLFCHVFTSFFSSQPFAFKFLIGLTVQFQKIYPFSFALILEKYHGDLVVQPFHFLAGQVLHPPCSLCCLSRLLWDPIVETVLLLNLIIHLLNHQDNIFMNLPFLKVTQVQRQRSSYQDRTDKHGESQTPCCDYLPKVLNSGVFDAVY